MSSKTRISAAFIFQFSPACLSQPTKHSYFELPQKLIKTHFSFLAEINTLVSLNTWSGSNNPDYVQLGKALKHKIYLNRRSIKFQIPPHRKLNLFPLITDWLILYLDVIGMYRGNLSEQINKGRTQNNKFLCIILHYRPRVLIFVRIRFER